MGQPTHRAWASSPKEAERLEWRFLGWGPLPSLSLSIINTRRLCVSSPSPQIRAFSTHFFCIEIVLFFRQCTLI